MTPVAPLHQVKRGSEDALVVAVEHGCRGRGVNAAEPRQDAILAAHVVGGLDAIAKGGATQNPLLVAGANQVREVGMAVGELLDGQRLPGELG